MLFLSALTVQQPQHNMLFSYIHQSLSHKRIKQSIFFPLNFTSQHLVLHLSFSPSESPLFYFVFSSIVSSNELFEHWDEPISSKESTFYLLIYPTLAYTQSLLSHLTFKFLNNNNHLKLHSFLTICAKVIFFFFLVSTFFLHAYPSYLYFYICNVGYLCDVSVEFFKFSFVISCCCSIVVGTECYDRKGWSNARVSKCSKKLIKKNHLSLRIYIYT